ncbi:RNA polymerase factor sigma-54 [Planococcus shenhongbingii]|uniref:RNA polymerase factor sigma-54 n=1 Tax=Planococcus shenhongbingii TaxID=3058398 RepID=UPI00261204EE|nr:RNA polymerase factor sigma-54 [Planococcus sp. N016]WKA59180.1 RNA polymerase factor sigma-54 [Planococcus sp. N016]
MELVLHQKQELNLFMTYKLRQAIELLQYSTYDLYQYLMEQEMENPLIELKEQKSSDLYEGTLNRSSITRSTSASAIEMKQSKEVCMRDKLMQQAEIFYRDVQDLKVIEYIIYNIDDNGYLNFAGNEQELSAVFNENEISRGIQLLQAVGPAGIGARNLKECLLLQVNDEFPDKELIECLIENFLELLANKKWEDIAARMGIPLGKVKEIHELMLTLNPRPCSFISDFSIQYVNPDIIVKPNGAGLSFYLNDGYLPEIHFNDQYSTLLNQNDETAKYLQEKYKSYQWLVSSLEKRSETINKIMQVLIKKQQRFFAEGLIALAPLTLKDVAEEIEMHESTVCRVTMNKFIQTPKGTFELRALFTSKLETSDGNSIAQTKVKMLLKSLIEGENKCQPLSDQKITDYFNEEKGIRVSRRTISKYREELNIPSSSRRKELTIK